MNNLRLTFSNIVQTKQSWPPFHWTDSSTYLEPIVAVVSTFAFLYLQLDFKVQHHSQTDVSAAFHPSLLELSLYLWCFMMMEVPDLDLWMCWQKKHYCFTAGIRTKHLISFIHSASPQCHHRSKRPVCAVIWGMYHTPVNRRCCTETLLERHLVAGKYI